MLSSWEMRGLASRVASRLDRRLVLMNRASLLKGLAISSGRRASSETATASRAARSVKDTK